MSRKKELVNPKNLILKVKDELKELDKRFSQIEMDRFIMIGRKQELMNFLKLLESANAVSIARM